MQEALVEAVRRWPDEPPDDPKALAGHGRLAQVHRRRAVRVGPPRARGAARRRAGARARPSRHDDTLLLLFLCCHPALTPASAVALTLRAVGGLTTRQIAEAYLVPEATMAQRISRAKRTVAGERLGAAGRPARRAQGALPDLQRGLHRRGRPGRGGDPADPAAGRAVERRARGRRPARADAAAPRPPRRPLDRRRRAGPAGRAGPVAAGTPR